MAKSVKAEPLKSVTVKLLFPVTWDGQEYSELTFRRMKVRDSLVAEDEKDEERAGLLLFAKLANVPVEVLEELDIEDFAEVGAAIVPLMGKRAAELLKEKGISASLGAI